MPFTLTKSLNSALVKTEPLSDTSNSGIPCVAKIDRSSVRVVEVFALRTALGLQSR